MSDHFLATTMQRQNNNSTALLGLPSELCDAINEFASPNGQAVSSVSSQWMQQTAQASSPKNSKMTNADDTSPITPAQPEPKKASLLGLPRELRDIIYELVFAGGEADFRISTLHKRQSPTRSPLRPPPKHSLLSVCSQIRAEAHKSYYKHTTFFFDTNWTCIWWLWSLSEENFSALSAVRIEHVGAQWALADGMMDVRVVKRNYMKMRPELAPEVIQVQINDRYGALLWESKPEDWRTAEV